MSKICTLFSGSSGNCTYLSNGSQSFLVDAGVSCKQILLSLDERKIDKSLIKGIFITHTHSDHIKGLRVLLSKINVPVYASGETLVYLIEHGIISSKNMYYDIEQKNCGIEKTEVSFFKTSHDCKGSGGYVFSFDNGTKAAVCTDLGFVSDDVRNSLYGCKAIVFESNHDVGMLQNGCYPFETKQRILSNSGHLSNSSCANELPEFVKHGTTNIILAHLSRENNTPELARVTAQSVLIENGMKENVDYLLYTAPVSGGKVIYF